MSFCKAPGCQAQEWQGALSSYRRAHGSAVTLTLDLRLPEWKTVYLCCFQALTYGHLSLQLGAYIVPTLGQHSPPPA